MSDDGLECRLQSAISTLSRVLTVLGLTLLGLDAIAKLSLLHSSMFKSAGDNFLMEWMTGSVLGCLGIILLIGIAVRTMRFQRSDFSPTILFVLLSVMLLPLSSSVQDVSWDGIWYHLQRVLFFQEPHWIEDPAKQLLQGPALFTPLLANNLRGLLIAATGIFNPFAAVSLNVSMAIVAGALFFQHFFFLSRPFRVALSATPVISYQIFSFQVDGFTTSFASLCFLLSILLSLRLLGPGGESHGPWSSGSDARKKTSSQRVLQPALAILICLCVLAQCRASFYLLSLTVVMPLLALLPSCVRLRKREELLALMKSAKVGKALLPGRPVTALLAAMGAVLSTMNPYGLLLKSLLVGASNHFFSIDYIRQYSHRTFDTGRPFPMDRPVFERFFAANIDPPLLLCLPAFDGFEPASIVKSLVYTLATSDPRSCGFGILSPLILVAALVISIFWLVTARKQGLRLSRLPGNANDADRVGILLASMTLVSVTLLLQIVLSQFLALAYWARINPFTYWSASIVCALFVTFLEVPREACGSPFGRRRRGLVMVARGLLVGILGLNIVGPVFAQGALQYVFWRSFHSGASRIVEEAYASGQTSLKFLQDEDELVIGVAVKFHALDRKHRLNIQIVDRDECRVWETSAAWVFPPYTVCH